MPNARKKKVVYINTSSIMFTITHVFIIINVFIIITVVIIMYVLVQNSIAPVFSKLIAVPFPSIS